MKLFEHEDDYGNIEYKRQIILTSTSKIHHYISQIKYRVTEGNGTAYYLIGINDDGTISNVSSDILNLSLTNFKKLVNALNYEIKNIAKYSYFDKNFYIIKIHADLDIYNDLSYFIT